MDIHYLVDWRLSSQGEAAFCSRINARQERGGPERVLHWNACFFLPRWPDTGILAATYMEIGGEYVDLSPGRNLPSREIGEQICRYGSSLDKLDCANAASEPQTRALDRSQMPRAVVWAFILQLGDPVDLPVLEW